MPRQRVGGKALHFEARSLIIAGDDDVDAGHATAITSNPHRNQTKGTMSLRPPIRPFPHIERWLLPAFLVFGLGWALGNAAVGWSHNLSDDHGFRQAQTAVSVVSLLEGG